MAFSRRDFLKNLAIGGAAAGIGLRLPKPQVKPRGKLVGSTVERVLRAGEYIRAGSIVTVEEGGLAFMANENDWRGMMGMATADTKPSEKVTVIVQGFVPYDF